MRKDPVSFTDFQKLDVRIGKIEEAEPIEGSTNLIRLLVDFGKELGQKKIISAIAKWYPPAKLKGKKYLFVVNLEPKQMMKEMSEGMILCADLGDDIKLIQADKKIPEGAIVR
jgi:methionine--tRNA ligase beta chain